MGGIKHLINQTNQGSDFADLSVDPNLSEKCFILQVSAYLKMIQELARDLINDCDHALQGMPTLATTIGKIHLSEIITNRDPSLKISLVKQNFVIWSMKGLINHS